MSKGSLWSDEEVSVLERAFWEKLTYREMEGRLPGRTPQAIAFKAGKLGLKKRERDCAVMDRFQAQVASFWHLIDLKRAGHSPWTTELNVPARGVYVTPLPVSVSSCGSPAALCAEI